jgi:hypothetical protein
MGIYAELFRLSRKYDCSLALKKAEAVEEAMRIVANYPNWGRHEKFRAVMDYFCLDDDRVLVRELFEQLEKGEFDGPSERAEKVEHVVSVPFDEMTDPLEAGEYYRMMGDVTSYGFKDFSVLKGPAEKWYIKIYGIDYLEIPTVDTPLEAYRTAKAIIEEGKGEK